MRKLGAELEIGDMINIGIRKRIGKIIRFDDHPSYAQFNKGQCARIAVTDVGSITVPDIQSVEVFGND